MSEQVLSANHVMRQMAERADVWRKELEEIVSDSRLGTAEAKMLNFAYVDLHVARDSLKKAADHIDRARWYRQKNLDARRPPENPEPSSRNIVAVIAQ